MGASFVPDFVAPSKMARQAQPPAIFLWIPFCHDVNSRFSKIGDLVFCILGGITVICNKWV
jgi:hypothetical protein